MALWPFRKRRKTKTAEGKNSVAQQHQEPPTVERKLSLVRKASARQNPRRSASRRRVVAAAVASPADARELQSYVSAAPPVLDHPLLPNRNSSDPMDTNFQLDPNFQPQKRSHEGGFSSYFVEIDRPMTSSSTSSARPHKQTSIVRRFSKRGREPKQAHTQPPPSAYIQQLARNASKRDGKRMRSFNSFEYDRPMSQSSLPRQSLSSSLSSVSSMRAYRIRSFELFTPRPRLRYESGFGTSPDGKQQEHSPTTISSRSNSRSNHEYRHRTGTDSHGNVRARVDELADDMDAKELREAMDRDRRRRERKRLQEQERLQKKLERKQKQRQLEQGNSGMGMEMDVDQDMDRNYQHNLERNQGMFLAQPERQMGESSRAAEAYGGFGPVHNPYPFPETEGVVARQPRDSRTTIESTTPISWLNDASAEDINKGARLSGRTDMITPVSMDSAEYTSESPTFDTAQQINVTSHSHAQISPIPSRNNSKAERNPKIQVDSPTTPNDQLNEEDEIRGKKSAWTSFIKKATAARIQKEQDIRVGQSTMVNGSDEEVEGLGSVSEPVRRDFYEVEQLRRREGQTPGRHIQDEIAFAMTALETGHVRGKDEIEDEQRDRFSPTPPSYPNYGRPSSSKSSLVPAPPRPPANPRNSSHSATPELNDDSPTIPPQGRTSSQQSHFRPSSHRYSPSMRYSSGAASPENGPRSFMSTSLASIDSEGSWLSGKMTNPRQSIQQISPLRTSATSLRRRYKEFDDGASFEGDDYFSGVEPRRPKAQNVEEYVYAPRMELSDDSEDDDNASINSEAEQKMWREGPAKKVVPQEIPVLPRVGALKGQGRPGPVRMVSSTDGEEVFMTPLEHPHERTVFSTPMEHPAARKSTVAEIVGPGRQ
ncbi:uncharacterized protein H6S33_004739 [Morchella sextelata]|uniref:uncharacterized protein n=1 Tax=Morchella sextelata TaxID=1174677 RepID=UPI001D050119|nr:uncharacterized protein H6S33_004739 [Morchella sextelata]KAH0605517.1 hypothetical protein H6S33_004739 [Morchella sextelata]